MSQKDVAEALHVSQALVGKWEAGLSEPSDENVAGLAKCFSVREELLYVDRPRKSASMSDYYHRALSKAKRTDVKAIHARCNLLDLQIDRLLNIREPDDDQIPVIDPDNHAGDVDRVAMMARTAMGVPNGPVANLVEVVERCGGIVIDHDLEVDEVDALCRWVPELPKLFFINGFKSADRIRFSLAHELGHTVMHFGKDNDLAVAEEQANRFASAFLLPPHEIKKDLRGYIDLAHLAALKRKWKVSMQAIVRCAFTHHVIDKRRYQSLMVQMSRKGWRKTEPITIESETPQRFKQLLQEHLDAGYSFSELAQLLIMTEEELHRTFGDHHSAPTWDDGVRLRLVR